MKDFLSKKRVSLSLRVYFIDALSAMALGLFSTLIIGLIIRTIGQQLELQLLIDIGSTAMSLYGPAIAVAIAYTLKAPPLVLFSTVVAGSIGAVTAGPAAAYVAALIATEIGKLVSKSTKVDILVTPFTVVVIGYLAAHYLGSPIAQGLTAFGQLINWSVEQQPFVMGILVATLMGLALTAPISSAAIAFMLELSGLAAGAATVGCAAQMIGFAATSYRDNGFGGFIAQAIGTSMLQIANIIKNPAILIPPTVAGIILAPIATVVWKMQNLTEGAGMGTSGFVGQIFTFTAMGFTADTLFKVLLLHFIGPALISIGVAILLKRFNLIKPGDMRIDVG